MSIQNGDISISANFQLNVSKPLDSRTIVSNFSDLANIAFKHSGMLVYVTALDAHFTLDSTNTWNLFSGQSGSLVADNGITISNDIIELGGDLVKTTSINTDNFNFSIINGTNGLINISDKILIGDWTTSSTPISGDSSYKIANTEFVTNAISLIPSYNGTLDRISVTSGIVDIDINYIGQTSINTVGSLSNGSLTTGFTPINDAEISSASTWNAKQDAIGYTPENLANKVDVITIGNGSNAYPTSDAVIDYIAFVQSRTTYVNNITGSDTTAEKYSTTLKYATIKKAILESAYGDTIRIENTGTDYTDHHMPMPDGVTVYAELGVVCKPTITTLGIPNQGPIFTTYNPTDMNDVSLGQSINDRVNFKVRGRGRFITRGWSGPDTDAFVFYRRYSTFDIEADEVSGFEHNGGGEYGTQVTFRNVLFTYQIDMYGQGHQVFNNCKFLDVLTQRRNLGFYAGKAVFNDCDFIRKETIIQYDLDASSRGLTDLQGLDCFAFKPASGGATAYFHFNNCSFYNNVGGHGISLFAGGDNTNSSELHIDDCSFFLNNDTKSPLYYNGINGLNNNHLFYLSNNISNTEPIAVNGATLTNQYSGSGFTIITEPINLNSISATTPLSYNNTSGTFSIQVANISQNGYISSTDWNTFNSKQNTLSLTTNGTSGSSTLISNTLNIPTYTLQGLGGQPQLNGTGFVKQTGTTSSYVSGTSAQFVKADGSLDSNSYFQSFNSYNYVKIDLNNGNDATALINRIDKPFLTHQACYDAIVAWDIANGSLHKSTYIEIVGDITLTTSILDCTTGVTLGYGKHNIFWDYKGKITLSKPSSVSTAAYINTVNRVQQNWTFKFANIIQTTNVGWVYGNNGGQNYNFKVIIDIGTLKMPNGVNDYGFYMGSSTDDGIFSADNLTIDITNDTGVVTYESLSVMGNVNIRILKTIGTVTGTSRNFLFFSSTKVLLIDSVTYAHVWNASINIFSVANGVGGDGGTIEYIFIKKFITATTGTATTLHTLVYCGKAYVINLDYVSCPQTGMNLFYIGNTTDTILDIDYIYTESAICSTYPYFNGIITWGIFESNGTSNPAQYFVMGGGATIRAGKTTYNKTAVSTTSAFIFCYTHNGSGYANGVVIIQGGIFYNKAVIASGVIADPVVRCYVETIGTNILTLRLNGCSFSSPAGNTVSTPIRQYADNTSHLIKVTGNFETNYLKSITGIDMQAIVDINQTILP